MARISFSRRQQTVEFYNPTKNWELDRQPIEVRLDPLTGHQCILSGALGGKVSILFPETNYGYLEQWVQDTQKRCFMCEGRWRERTPRYPEGLLPEGRITRGEVVLFPNLYPVAPYHAVVMIGEKHGRTPDEFSVSLLAEAFSVSLEFIRRCIAYDPEALYFTINANFMPPAGGSTVHPHLQILGSSVPSTHHRLLLEKSRAYLAENGSCYWLDLVEAERETGERWLGGDERSQWLTAFAPVGVNEVNGVWTEASNFLDWEEQDILAMAEGLHRALATYHQLKFSTFNYSCFSGPLGQASPEFRCFLRLVNRQNIMPYYRADDYFLQKLLGDEIIVTEPERLAALIRERFPR